MSVSDTDVKDVTGSFPSKNELARVIRDHLIQCSGVACSGAALDTQVRFLDSNIRVALIRVPREYCQIIRASITLLNEIQNKRVAISTLSVNGSARTAKMNAIKQVQNDYRKRIKSLADPNDDTIGQITNNTRKDIDRLCQSMEETLDVITNIDY